jgi:hypothetical protein
MRALLCGGLPSRSFIQIPGQLKGAAAAERRPARHCCAIAAWIAGSTANALNWLTAFCPPCYGPGMILLRQTVFAVFFAVTAVAVAQYILWAMHQ